MVRTFAAEDWTGPHEGERGGTYWVNRKSGERTYEDPTDGVGSGGGGANAGNANSAESTQWEAAAQSNGLDHSTSKALQSGIHSIASDNDPSRQTSRLKSFAASIAALPVNAMKSVVSSFLAYAKSIAKVGARVVGAAGVAGAGIALSAAIIVAATHLPAMVPGAVALLAAIPVGYGIKKLLTATSKGAGRVLRGGATPGVRYSEHLTHRMADGWQGPFEGERGGRYWISPSGEKSYNPPGEHEEKQEPKAMTAGEEKLADHSISNGEAAMALAAEGLSVEEIEAAFDKSGRKYRLPRKVIEGYVRNAKSDRVEESQRKRVWRGLDDAGIVQHQIEQQKTIEAELKKRGAVLKSKSPTSPSSYWELPNGRQIRVSDHELPPTAERDHAATVAPRAEFITNRFRTADEVSAMIQSELDSEND